MEKSTLQHRYERRLKRVSMYVHEHRDQDLDLNQLAKICLHATLPLASRLSGGTR